MNDKDKEKEAVMNNKEEKNEAVVNSKEEKEEAVVNSKEEKKEAVVNSKEEKKDATMKNKDPVKRVQEMARKHAPGVKKSARVPAPPKIQPRKIEDEAVKLLEEVPDHLVPGVKRLHNALRIKMIKGSDEEKALIVVIELLRRPEGRADRYIRGRVNALNNQEEGDMKGERPVSKDKSADASGPKTALNPEKGERPRMADDAETKKEDNPYLYDTNRFLDIILLGRDPKAKANSSKGQFSKERLRGHKRAHSMDEFLAEPKRPKPESRFVDDWKCSTCQGWNRELHATCCKKHVSDSEARCPGLRRHASEKQADDGTKPRYDFSPLGNRWAGDWHCDSCERWYYHYTKYCQNCGWEKAGAMGYELPFGQGYPKMRELGGLDEKRRLSMEMAAIGKKHPKHRGWIYRGDEYEKDTSAHGPSGSVD